MSKKNAVPTAFGLKLREKRIAAGMTQTELAEAVGMKQPTVAALEKSPTANPTLDTILRLAAALKCEPNDLIG